LTVDVEDWFHANYRSAPALDTGSLPRRVEQSVERVLDTLAARAVRATFFVLGAVAREHPGIVPRIAAAGHEIGCHGMTHALAYETAPDDFARAIAEARALLRAQSGQSVLGFRAPSWSVTARSLWALDAIAAAGFRYDSSIFPHANYLYGLDGAPRTPYVVETDAGPLIEVPPPLVGRGPLTLGAGGGFYLRLLPTWVHRRAAAASARARSVFLAYVHPRELDPGAWPLRLPLSLKEDAIYRLRIASVPRKLGRLLAGRTWQPLGEVLRAAGALP
ncbi:MAG TPA: polysaccharide deacetylase family protein, partial [Candidatus Binatia bacterium]|nr:polysaccharide deacetylase family protein [Candidatus Binatia bacterium]